jgi:hypothetical protein
MPTPRWQDAVKLVIQQHNVQFKKPEVVESLKQCFYKVGLAPDESILKCKDLSTTGDAAMHEFLQKNEQPPEEFYSDSSNYVTDAKVAFEKFTLREHTRDILTVPMPVTQSASAPALPGSLKYPMFLGLYDQMNSLKTSNSDSYMKILKSLARDYNIPGNLGHEEYCNRLCKLITGDELTKRIDLINTSILKNKPILIVMPHEDDEPVGDDDHSVDSGDDGDDVDDGEDVWENAGDEDGDDDDDDDE